MKKIVLILTMFGFLSSGAFAAEVYGKWATQNKEAEIDIIKCGDSICGLIAKETVKGSLDKENADPKLRSRPILGMQMFKLKTTSNPTKWEGDLYNPRDGKTYSGVINMLNDNEIKLEGCVLIFCQGEVWSRI